MRAYSLLFINNLRVKADASDFATWGVLLMKYENEKWRLVVYIYKSNHTSFPLTTILYGSTY